MNCFIWNRKQVQRFNLGKRRLANMMGEDPESYTDDDVKVLHLARYDLIHHIQPSLSLQFRRRFIICCRVNWMKRLSPLWKYDNIFHKSNAFTRVINILFCNFTASFKCVYKPNKWVLNTNIKEACMLNIMLLGKIKYNYSMRSTSFLVWIRKQQRTNQKRNKPNTVIKIT